MSYRIELGEAAIVDLDDLHAWIEQRAGTVVADGYQMRIRRLIRTLADFPNRGTPRELLGPGLRSITFERRQVIFYRVAGEQVVVLRVLHGARDLPGALG